MKLVTKLLVTLFIFTPFYSCDGNSKSEYIPMSDDASVDGMDGMVEDFSQGALSEEQTFTCQLCGGSGVMTYFDGSIITCIGCEGQGELTAEYLRQKYNSVMGEGGDGMNNDEEDSPYTNGGRNQAQIERELAWHERNLELLREQQGYIEGMINSSQISQEIINEEYEIKRLRRMLENME